jgi:uncharacterized protein YifE (UPF0438 family)
MNGEMVREGFEKNGLFKISKQMILKSYDFVNYDLNSATRQPLRNKLGSDIL